MDYPLVMCSKNSEASLDFELVNLFAQFFQKSYAIATKSVGVYHYYIKPFDIFGAITLSELEIFSALSTVKLSCFLGPD